MCAAAPWPGSRVPRAAAAAGSSEVAPVKSRAVFILLTPFEPRERDAHAAPAGPGAAGAFVRALSHGVSKL